MTLQNLTKGFCLLYKDKEKTAAVTEGERKCIQHVVYSHTHL